jgi:hypothetical protein
LRNNIKNYQYFDSKEQEAKTSRCHFPLAEFDTSLECLNIQANDSLAMKELFAQMALKPTVGISIPDFREQPGLSLAPLAQPQSERAFAHKSILRYNDAEGHARLDRLLQKFSALHPHCFVS